MGPLWPHMVWTSASCLLQKTRTALPKCAQSSGTGKGWLYKIRLLPRHLTATGAHIDSDLRNFQIFQLNSSNFWWYLQMIHLISPLTGLNWVKIPQQLLISAISLCTPPSTDMCTLILTKTSTSSGCVAELQHCSVPVWKCKCQVECECHRGPILGCTKEGPLIGRKGEKVIPIPAHLSSASGEKAKLCQNPASPAGSAWCVPRVREVGTGPLQLHKMCRLVLPTCWFGAEHSQPDAPSHSWVLQYLDVGAEASVAEFETKNARRSCWHLPFQAVWELSLAQRALEQL